jgi:hydroxyacylglutathione hydrolase
MIILVAEDRETMLEARTRLARVGMEDVIGFVEDGMSGWFRAGLPAEQVPQITVQDLQRELEHVQVIDVRMPGEWEAGHIQEAHLKPLPKLTAMLDDLDRTRPVAVHCKSGYRSSIATSLLQRAGFSQVMNVIGGFDAWSTCGLPVAHPDKEAA